MNEFSQLANVNLFLDNRLKAKFLYWCGWKITEIAEVLDEKERTVQAWKTRDDWEKTKPENRVAQAIEARLITLIFKNKKSSGDMKEVDLLMRELERLARIERYRDTGKESDLNPNIQNRNAVAKKQKKPNTFTEQEVEILITAFEENLYDYQWDWYRAGDQRTRAILKSRQIGATYYFAREAFIDALKTGRNQIFLSASKAQAHIFKTYIQQFAFEHTGVELKGDPIIIGNNQANLTFLGTNARTAQGHHGNFYFDEFFWTYGFNELNKVASGMAMHKKWRKTYFSTPSTMAHQAYAFWTGERYNKGRPKDQRLNIDVSHDALKRGRYCEDKIWRQIVTILDAENGGCDLFDIDELRFEYSAEEFANLLMCQFIDDGASIFPLNMLQACMVDSWEAWSEDYKPFHIRPLASRPVWVGYDPAETGDSAGLVVVAPPSVANGKFRILERHQFRGMDFKAQAEQIRQITLRYNVTYIGLDTTGMGTGVAQLVRQFFPALTTFSYSPEVKTQLVLKTLDVIRNGRLEFDAGHTDIAQSLMSIKKTLTASQRQMTFTAGRSEEIGHADLAWALMHAVYNEPLEGTTISNSSILEIYS
ncbi:terminase large subunit domain-containing protein [Acinetobacter baumannii]|uniref:terminase large subunit domain-containing protein n=1 Tax=Acinetobacter baumannii TaxID=470 RepID=UPI0018A946AE|nr:terminase family protein [Acinetobacter baumannii]EKT8316679.1 terminase family protein [Acinetobacter baumannii]EKU4658167.1 terminase family protein [Acinetobacter baumannii]EKV5598982.1 terminase family protein [Acinetobacter baumannii]EKV5699861.1 terminase family protein [Acinetobacter baumannii]EKV6803110.1 terminase family protein [Acinetobacter baumannii]